MSKEESSPIALWLSGITAPTAFGGGAVRFQVRRAMSNRSGKLQAGMFTVFTLESISQFFNNDSFNMDPCDLEVFDIPSIGAWITVHIEGKRSAYHSTIFNGQNIPTMDLLLDVKPVLTASKEPRFLLESRIAKNVVKESEKR